MVNGTAGVTAATADVAITWSWGRNTVATDFDPNSDSIFIDWFSAGDVEISEVGGSVLFSIPSQNQSVTLQGVKLADLSSANFTIMDSNLAGEILGRIGSAANSDTTDGTDNTSADNTDADGTSGNGGAGSETGGQDTTGDGGNGASQNTGASNGAGEPIIAAYFPEWGIYGRDHTVSDVPADNMTHLIYAFTEIEDDFTLGLFDDWAATGYPFGDHNSVDGVADTAGQDLMGNFNQLAELKEANPHLTVMVGIVLAPSRPVRLRSPKLAMISSSRSSTMVDRLTFWRMFRPKTSLPTTSRRLSGTACWKTRTAYSISWLRSETTIF